MGGVSIAVEIRDQALRKWLAAAPRDWRRNAAPAIGLVLVRGTHERFRREVDPEGNAWAKLNPVYAMSKKGPGILRESSMLMRSITYKATSDAVHVGTNRIYARVHQLGATIRPKNKSKLTFRMGSRWVMVDQVQIKARPYLGVSRADDQAIRDVIEALIRPH